MSKINVFRFPESQRFKCDFCDTVFLNREQRKSHTFTHFATKCCRVCSCLLIRIADEWYSSHKEAECTNHCGIAQDAEYDIEIEHSNEPEKTSEVAEKTDTIEIDGVILNVVIDGEGDERENGMDDRSSSSRRSKRKEKIQCEFCEKQLLNETTYRKHLKNMHKTAGAGSTRPECDVCGRTFTSVGNLNLHKNIHSDTKPFICNHCGRGFSQFNHLKEHLNSEEGRRPWKCELCAKSFTRQPQLRVHQRVHTREKPYKCTVHQCDRAYAHEIDLKRHKYGTHGIYTKKHTCPTCGRVFPENKLLKRHIESQHRTEDA